MIGVDSTQREEIADELLAYLECFVRHARSDIHAERFLNESTNKWAYKPVSLPIDTDCLRRHLENGPHLGCYLMLPGSNTTQIGGFDLDDHSGAAGWEVMRKCAADLITICGRFGLSAWPVRSGGGHGIHLLFRWRDSQPAAAVRELLQLVLEIAGYREGSGGVNMGEIEIFPKQSEVAIGACGNLLALPFGRDSIPLCLNLQPRAVPANWLSSTPLAALEIPVCEEPAQCQDQDLAEALRHVLADDYSIWLRFGLALKRAFPESGVELWNTWSQTSQKYPGEADIRRLWSKLRPRREGGITLGSIYYMAQQNGWQPEQPSPSDGKFADYVDVLAGEMVSPPFPVDALPEPFRSYIINQAAAMQVQPDLIAGPMLTVAAAMLGRDWQIRPQGDRTTWTEPSILWAGCIADSGSMKSAAAQKAMKFVHNLQLEFRDEYRKELDNWQSAKTAGEDIPKPLLESCYVADATVESLKLLLNDHNNRNPRGLIFHADELAGWFNGLNQYKAKGNDRQFYLSLYDGGLVRVDRKNDGDPVIISRTGLSMFGGTQPAVVRSLFKDGEDGLTPRFQFIWPMPYGEVTLQSANEDRRTWKDVAEILRSMRAARPVRKPDLEIAPDYFGEALTFDSNAQVEFDKWYVASRNRREQGMFGSYLEKQRGLLARLSMILHGMQYGRGMAAKSVTLEILSNALRLVTYFEAHARRLYDAVDAHPAQAGALKIARWIRRKKKASFTLRDIRENDWREFSKERDENSILSALQFLEARGWLRIEEKRPGSKGGRPTLIVKVNPIASNGG